MEKEKKVPVLRFPTFSEEWINESLGDLMTFKNGVNAEKQQYGKGIKFINVLDIINNDFITHERIMGSVEVSKAEQEKNNVQYGDVLFQRSSETREEVGQANVYLDNKEAVFGGFVIRGRAVKDYDSLFMNYLLKTTKARKEITDRSGGSTRYNVGQETLQQVKVYSTSVSEQKKISSFLGVVDDKIQQLISKKTLLEQYKKGVMHQLFSRQIHFKDEKGRVYQKWEENKLKDFIVQFIVPMRDKPKVLSGNIPWCRIEDFDGRYLSSSKSSQGVSLQTIEEMNLKVYPVNTLLVSCSANLGICAIVKQPLITNQTFIGLVPNEQIVDVDFLYYAMTLQRNKLNSLSSGTTISYLSREQFEHYKISIPVLDEQKKISIFLMDIDNKIEQVSKQLEYTHSFKKGLLQKMFV